MGLRSLVGSLMDRLRGATPVAVSLGMQYDRQPRAEWQAMLDAQHTPGTARLIVAWEPGDAWQPVHRWMLWQVQAWAYVPDAIRQEILGPHPRSTGHYCAAGVCGCRYPVGRWKGGATSLIDRRTWELARQIHAETGEWTFPRRLWVVQGTNGGHPFRIGQSEKKVRQESGLTPDVPSAGDLPYAEPDPRVLVALERYDLWRYAAGLGDPMTAAARMTIRRMSDQERHAHRAMWSRWETLADEWADGAAHAARKDGLHYHRYEPVGSQRRVVDYEAARERYINDTDLEDVA